MPILRLLGPVSGFRSRLNRYLVAPLTIPGGPERTLFLKGRINPLGKEHSVSQPSTAAVPQQPRRRRKVLAVTIAASFGLAGLAATSAPIAQADDTPAYMNEALPFDVRAADLVSRMTWTEKVGQLRSSSSPSSVPGATENQAIPRLGVVAYRYWNEALHGVVGVSGATSFPSALGIGSTWNRALVKEMGTAIGSEARAGNNRGDGNGLTYWSPTVNLNRDPRWGRADESYGEDPYLMGEIGKQFVSGVQTGHPTYTKAVSTPKHYFANNAENYRRNGDAVLSERALHEYYTPAFAELTGVEGSASRSFMTSYNRINGVPASASFYAIETLARRTWGFDGFTTSDCDAILDEHQRHLWVPEGFDRSITAAESTAWSLKAGTDLACDNGNWALQYVGNVTDARDQGLITENDVDVVLVRVFTERMRLGEFDDAAKVPYRGQDYSVAQIGSNSPVHTAIANQMADEAPVLLKNDAVTGTSDKALPLTAEDADNVVLVGYMATEAVLGGYSGSPSPAPISAHDGLIQAVKSYNPNATVQQIDGITPKYGAKPGVRGVRFTDAAGDTTFTSTPPPQARNDVWDWLGWQGIQYDPVENYPTAMMPNQDWGGMFSITTTLPAETEKVSVQQISESNAFIPWTAGTPCPPGMTYMEFWGMVFCTGMVDQATNNPDQASSIYIGGTFEVREGSEVGPIVATLPADGESSSTVFSSYTGTTGSPVTLYFLYKPPTYTVSLTAQEAQDIRDASAVVVRVGTRQGESAEEMDRYSIDLPRNQTDLVRLVRQLNPKTVVWVESVGQMNIEPFRVPWQAPPSLAPDGLAWDCTTCSVPAIIWANYNGQAQGQAFGRILFGKANPSGKLTYSWYSNILDIGHVNDYNLLPTSTTKGRTYLYTDAPVSYPFGWGLSYSTFEYSNMRVAKSSISGDETLSVSVDVTNSSAIVGKEAVQLYVTAPDSNGKDRPKRQLKGFEKVALGPGATKTVTIDVPADQLWFWDDVADARTYDLGTWTFRIGGSSVSGISGSFQLTSAPSVSLGVVMAIPNGVVLNTAAPGNTIDAGLSAARSDEGFFDLSDRATVKVVYTSSDDSVATVDQTGTVSPAGAGHAEITATVTVGDQTKSDSFPVIVYDGAFESDLGGEQVTLFADQLLFAGSTITPAEAASGIQLAASMAGDPAATVTYLIAPMDVNNAGAVVTPAGELTASGEGIVRVTAVAQSNGDTFARTATIKVQANEPVDAVDLGDAIDEASSPTLDQGDFTSTSWTAFQTALSAASATFANPAATQAQIDSAVASLASARSALQPRGDLTPLNAVLTAVSALPPASYTAATWAPLAQALDAARALAANPAAASQAQVDAAAAAVSSAIDGLRPVTPEPPAPDTSVQDALQDLVDQVEALTPGNSTDASLAQIQAALAAAQAALTSSNASAAQVNAALAALSALTAKLAPLDTPVVNPPSATQTVQLVKASQRTVRLVAGKTVSVAAKGYTAGGAAMGTVKWKSSNKKVATVSASGKVTAKKAGKATLTATAGGKSTTVKVTVVAKRPKAYKSTKVSASVPATMTIGQVAYVSGSYAPAKATGAKIGYASSNAAVVQVSSTGQLVAKAAGSATITVKTQHASKKYTVTVQ
ncbi:MAG: glycoside hydrolase family 3 C-terminal domain-containing protein [Bifidobacteriaceae bacterium]|jgi:beta-glucosidase-like glycosyl hydrolase/uncharacterized protein YjdB|nr:glycoside hydrolase family 3 C-terminal domain-containing protein [Bifidobacteriaceae bacterium]